MIRADELESIENAWRCPFCGHSMILHDEGDEGYGANCNVEACPCSATMNCLGGSKGADGRPLVRRNDRTSTRELRISDERPALEPENVDFKP